MDSYRQKNNWKRKKEEQFHLLARGNHLPTYSKLEEGTTTTKDDCSIGYCGWILFIISIILCILTFPFSLFICIKIVNEYERAVVFRVGRLLDGSGKGPGLILVLPCIDNYVKVDMRLFSFKIPPQEVLTRDSVTIAVDAVTYIRVNSPAASICNVKKAIWSTNILAATTLRTEIGMKNLSDILQDRNVISQSIQHILEKATDPWGVKVERVELKDVALPKILQRAMAAEAEAAREAEAKVISAKGEVNASHALKKASEILLQSPQAFQLRYLQTLKSISAEKNSTVIFPLPIDILGEAVSS